jgi:hypothetical protein
MHAWSNVLECWAEACREVSSWPCGDSQLATDYVFCAAGGYDALWILVLSPSPTQSSAEEQVRALFNSWKEMSVQPLSHKACLHTPASEASQQEKKGLAQHQLEEVAGLAEAIRRR